MTESPRFVEFICRHCGLQGLARGAEDEAATLGERLARPFPCPRCGRSATAFPAGPLKSPLVDVPAVD